MCEILGSEAHRGGGLLQFGKPRQVVTASDPTNSSSEPVATFTLTITQPAEQPQFRFVSDPRCNCWRFFPGNVGRNDGTFFSLRASPIAERTRQRYGLSRLTCCTCQDATLAKEDRQQGSPRSTKVVPDFANHANGRHLTAGRDLVIWGFMRALDLELTRPLFSGGVERVPRMLFQAVVSWRCPAPECHISKNQDADATVQCQH
jgi:hypothetical protein